MDDEATSTALGHALFLLENAWVGLSRVRVSA
jgi:hypothetical protein